MSKYELKYRVVPNPTYNRNNAELPYTIVVVDYDPKTKLIREKGTDAWTDHKCDLFSDKKRVENWFVSLVNNSFVTAMKADNVELEEKLKNTNKALRLAVELLCNPGSHPLIRKEIERFGLISGVVEYLKEKAMEDKK